MIKTNSEITTAARASLNGKWALAVATFFVYSLIIGGLSNGVNISHVFSDFFFGFFVGLSLVMLIIGGPLTLGIVTFSLNIVRNTEARFEQLFEGFGNFGKAVAAYLLMLVFVLLWSLLLIIPGIIAAISYSQTFFILADNKDMDAMDVLDKSKEMMYGYKWKYFCLCLRFFGWMLLCILTLGIGFLWLTPYMYISFTHFYEEIKANDVSREMR